MPDASQQKEIKESSGFPPQTGELMVRQLWKDVILSTGQAKATFCLENELCWYRRVGQPGESWDYQRIAVIKNQQGGEPDISPFTDTATISASVDLDENTRIMHRPASDDDLREFSRLVAKFYESKNVVDTDKARANSSSWLEQIIAKEDLLPKEKERLKNICQQTFSEILG